MKKLALCFLAFIFYSMPTFADYTNDLDEAAVTAARRNVLLAYKNSPPTAPEPPPTNTAPQTTIDPRLTGKETVEQTDDGFLRILNHQEPSFDMQFKLNIQGNTIQVTEKLEDTSGPDPDINTYYTYEIDGYPYTLTKRQWYDFIDRLFSCHPQEYWAATLGTIYGDYTKSLGGAYNAQTIMELYMQKVYIPKNIPNWQQYRITGVADNYLIGEEFKRRGQTVTLTEADIKKLEQKRNTNLTGEIF